MVYASECIVEAPVQAAESVVRTFEPIKVEETIRRIALGFVLTTGAVAIITVLAAFSMKF